MRVLLLSQGRSIEDQPDFDAALREAVSLGEPVELKNLPYIGFVEKYGGRKFYNEVLRINEEFKPDLVFFQFFHSANPGDPRPCVAALHASVNSPLVFGSIGDAFDTGFKKWFGRRLPRFTLQLASVADAFFSSSMGATAKELLANGAKRVIFLPNAFCLKHFPLPDIDCHEEKKYDIIALGSYSPIITKRPWIGLSRGVTRLIFVREMFRRFGSSFALFGRGWKKGVGRGVVPYNEQISLFRSGRVVVDIPAQTGDEYYTSDRAFFILGSGSPLVIRETPRLRQMFRADEQAFFAKTICEIPDVCARVLAMSRERLLECRRSAIQSVRTRHLISNRMDTLLSVYEAIRLHKGVGHIRLWHFLPEIDIISERQYAILNWQD